MCIVYIKWVDNIKNNEALIKNFNVDALLRIILTTLNKKLWITLELLKTIRYYQHTFCYKELLEKQKPQSSN